MTNEKPRRMAGLFALGGHSTFGDPLFHGAHHYKIHQRYAAQKRARADSYQKSIVHISLHSGFVWQRG